MEICEEMKKLRAYLDTHGIGWRDQSGGNEAAWMCRTKFRYRGHSWPVILRRYVDGGGDSNGVFCMRDGKKVMYEEIVKEVERKDG